MHAATQTVEALAPNTIATIYGTNLSFDTVAAPGAAVSGTLPTTLDGVTVYVGPLPANLFYVSPTQINFLIPYELTAGPVNIIVARQGLAGPTAQIQLNTTAPALFTYNGFAIASHLNGSLIDAASPAQPGEIIILYAAGLGRTSPDTSSGRLAPFPSAIVAESQLEVLLAGTACPPGSVLYAGLAPGFAGLYQINLTLPATFPLNPAIQLSIGSQISPPGLPLAAAGTSAAQLSTLDPKLNLQ